MHVYKNIYFKSNVPIFVHVSSELLAELSVCKPKNNKIIRSLRFAGEPDDERRFMVSTTQTFSMTISRKSGNVVKVTEMSSSSGGAATAIVSLRWTDVFTDRLPPESGRLASSDFLFLICSTGKTCSLSVCSAYAPVETVVVCAGFLFFFLPFHFSNTHLKVRWETYEVILKS